MVAPIYDREPWNYSLVLPAHQVQSSARLTGDSGHGWDVVVVHGEGWSFLCHLTQILHQYFYTPQRERDRQMDSNTHTEIQTDIQ